MSSRSEFKDVLRTYTWEQLEEQMDTAVQQGKNAGGEYSYWGAQQTQQDIREVMDEKREVEVTAMIKRHGLNYVETRCKTERKRVELEKEIAEAQEKLKKLDI